MINHIKRSIFIEVPKTGSSSVRAILGYPPKPHLNLWQIKLELETHWTFYRGITHKVIACGYSFVPPTWRHQVGRLLFERYFKFGFVRNPWDRLVSLYERGDGQPAQQRMPFDDFVEWAKYSSSTCLYPVPHRYQLDWFVDPSGRVLADFIGKFENIEQDWSHVARRLRLGNVTLPHHNRSPKKTKHYTEYYNSRTRELVQRHFAVDIEHFGYEFGK